MSSLLDALYLRGEFVSLVVVLVVLWVAAPRVASLIALPRAPIGSLYSDSVIVFVVSGRVAYLLAESPETLLDPLVAIRVQGGIDPLWGAVATLAVLAWAARRQGAAAYWPLATAWALGLAIAVAAYDLSCPLRDACYGARAEPPLGFRMSGLADTRLATPALEGALLLALLGALVLTWRRWRAGVAAHVLVGGVALLRLGLAPLSATGWSGWGAEEAALAVVVSAAGAGAAWRQLGPTSRPAPG